MLRWLPTIANTLIVDTTIVFAVGLLCALLARRVRQSPLIGYLIAGLIIGPYGLRLVHDQVNISFLADVGVVLLMFALGVQLSLRQLLDVRWLAIVGGLGQIVLCILLGVGVGRVLGLTLASSIILGYVLSMSSSVLLVRLLSEHDSFHSHFGRIALGFSVMQDLMAVVLISTLPFLQENAITSFSALTINLVKAVVFVSWVVILARWGAPFILDRASFTGSREIFLLTVVVLSLGGAILSGLFGFSYALGAFLAGLVISESTMSQAVLAEVIPLRDIFGMLFFVSLGMLVNPLVVAASWTSVLIYLLATVVGKAGLILLLLLLCRQHTFTALLTGVVMAQIGEFSFVISREALSLGEIVMPLNMQFLSVAILSIAITPALVNSTHWLYHRYQLAGRLKPGARLAIGEEELLLPEGGVTVLLCGYGRVGRTIAQALDTFRIPFMVIDIDRRAVDALRTRGICAVYGDASNRRLLERVGAANFRMAVIAVSDRTAVRIIAMHLRNLNPAVRLLLRSHTDTETALYLYMGVEGVVQIELEASLAFVQEVLTTAAVDTEIVNAYLEDIRIEYYEGLRPRESRD